MLVQAPVRFSGQGFARQANRTPGWDAKCGWIMIV